MPRNHWHTVMIRRLYNEWIDDEWFGMWARVLQNEANHVPTDAEIALAFITWAEVIHGVEMTYDEYDSAVYE